MNNWGKRKIGRLILFLFWGLPFFTLAQEQYYTLELINEETRASFGSVNSLYQDSTGIIWLGHFGKGLEYYDGKKIRRFHLKNEGAFADKEEVFEVADGLLYLNYGNKVGIFDPIHQIIVDSIPVEYPYEDSQTLDPIAVEKYKGPIWGIQILSELQGDSLITSFHVYYSSHRSPLKRITVKPLFTYGKPVIRAFRGNCFLKIENGFIEMDSLGVIQKRYELPDFEMKYITNENCVLEESGTFWFVQSPKSIHRLFKLNLPNQEIQFIDSFPYSWYIISKFDDTGILGYLKKIGHRLFLDGKYQIDLNTGEKIDLKKTSSVYDRENIRLGIKEIIQDKTGTLFYGYPEGFLRFQPQPNVFKIIPRLTIRAFAEDDNGLIYGLNAFPVYGETGISVYNPLTDSVKWIKDKPLKFWYSAFYKEGKLYFSLNSFDLKTKVLTPFEGASELFNNLSTVLLLLVNDRELWVTKWSEDFVIVYDFKTLTIKKIINIPPLKGSVVDFNDIYLRASDSTIWLGTFGKGIFVFSKEGEILDHLTTNEKSSVVLRSNIVSSFYEDSLKNMWIGHGSGISKIAADFSTIRHFTINPEAPDYYIIYGILPEDDDRFLWLSTNEGIFRFDSETGYFMDFPLNPLVMDVEYNRTSYHKAKNGQLYFGGADLRAQNVTFFPEEVVDFYQNQKTEKVPIIFSKVAKYNGSKDSLINYTRGLQALKEITLNPGDRYFTLEFLSTDYRSPEDNYYSYYLENYEKHWNEPQRNNNVVRYENLPPGEYTLKMRAALMRDNIALNERHLTVNVLPYWYQTWWSKALLAVLIIGVFFLFNNYRLRRQYDRQEALRLQEMDQLKTRLYTNITHEFRTPLTVIMGMNDNIKGFEKERNLIRRNADNLLRLINQLLDLSKLDSGSLKMNLVQGDIIGYLRYLTESFYSMASDKRVSLRFESDVETLEMDFDEEKIQHILFNLLSNAIKFTRPGGEVVLKTGSKSQEGKEWLTIEVKDTGVGIPEEDLVNVFERFYQVDVKEQGDRGEKKVSQTFGGTGIGLALTKEITDLLKGTIYVESEVGKGTTFTVQLPAVREPSTPQVQIQKTPEKEIKQSISDITDHLDQYKSEVLIVEDSPGVVTYIKSLLQKDYSVRVAINGQEGIDMALEHIPDVIITDVMMPEKSGFEVCEILKKEERTSHIPIIMLTAKADISSKVEGLETGADAYLAKPFEKEELLVRLRKLLELRQTLQNKYKSLAKEGLPNVLEEETEPQSSIEDAFLQKLIDVIEPRLDDSEFTIPDLSQAAAMSHTQLYRKLKAVTGKTPSQFIRSIRLRKAMELLKTSDLNISEIAYDVGFSGPQYFNKVFKEEFGYAPGKVRE